MRSSGIVGTKPTRQPWIGLPVLLGFLLVQPNALLHAANISVIATAARADDTAEVRRLIANHTEVNSTAADGSTALLWAAYHSNLEMTKALLAAKAEVDAANRYGVTPLLQASRNGNVEIMRALLDAGAQATKWHAEGETPLMAAARTGKVDAVKLLLEHGAFIRSEERRVGKEWRSRWSADRDKEKTDHTRTT